MNSGVPQSNRLPPISRSCIRPECGKTDSSGLNTGPDGPRTLCKSCCAKYSELQLICYQEPKSGKVSAVKRNGWRAVKVMGFRLKWHKLAGPREMRGAGRRQAPRDLMSPLVVPVSESREDCGKRGTERDRMVFERCLDALRGDPERQTSRGDERRANESSAGRMHIDKKQRLNPTDTGCTDHPRPSPRDSIDKIEPEMEPRSVYMKSVQLVARPDSASGKPVKTIAKRNVTMTGANANSRWSKTKSSLAITPGQQKDVKRTQDDTETTDVKDNLAKLAVSLPRQAKDAEPVTPSTETTVNNSGEVMRKALLSFELSLETVTVPELPPRPRLALPPPMPPPRRTAPPNIPSANVQIARPELRRTYYDLKVQYKGTVRRMRLPLNIRHETFMKCLRKFCQIVEEVEASYEDEDKDMVLLQTDMDMCALYELVRKGRLGVVRIEVVHKTRRNEPSVIVIDDE